jgi:hypothetical protein
MVATREDRLGAMESTAAARRAGAPLVRINRSQQQRRPTSRASRDAEKWRVDDIYAFDIRAADHLEVISGKFQADDFLVRQLKQRVNLAQICRQDLYAFIGAGPEALFTGRNAAYNLEYGLRYRPTITLECARRWLAVLGETLGVYFQSAENGWHDKLVQIRDLLLQPEGVASEDLCFLASEALPGEAQDFGPMEVIAGPASDTATA